MNKILVVDDDVSVLKVVRLMLESRGYRVSGATDSQQALREVQTELFDLALVDLMLGAEDGIELMEAIHKVNPELPVIILTAFGTIEKAEQAMKKGAYGFLTKPLGRQELLGQINGCLEKSRLLKQVNQLNHSVEERYSENYLVHLLELTGGNVTQAAKLAGKNRSELCDVLRKHGLNPEDYRRKSDVR